MYIQIVSIGKIGTNLPFVNRLKNIVASARGNKKTFFVYTSQPVPGFFLQLSSLTKTSAASTCSSLDSHLLNAVFTSG